MRPWTADMVVSHLAETVAQPLRCHETDMSDFSVATPHGQEWSVWVRNWKEIEAEAAAAPRGRAVEATR